MKIKFVHFAVMLAFLTLVTLNLPLSIACAQGTAFTYQGRVTDNGTNFNGSGQFKFALVTSTNASRTATATANAPSGGFITGYVVTSGGNGYVAAPSVTVFGGGGSGATATAHLTGNTVTSITVNNTGNGLYTSAPTVLIAPPPANTIYTTYWSNDGTSSAGSEPSAAVNVTVSGGLFTVVLGDTTIPNMAAISASLFNQPNLQLRIWFNDGVHGFAALDPAQNLTPAPYATFANTANNLTSTAQLNVNGLIIQPNSDGAPNVIGGSSVNYVSSGVVGATIAGGGTTNYFGAGYVISNSVTADFGTVSGGDANTASGFDATVGGGEGNTASGLYATVGGGDGNTASVDGATVGGGIGNTASGSAATVSGGDGNTASGDSSFAAGTEAQAVHNGSFVWADHIAGNFSSTAANQFSVRASGGIRFAGDLQFSGGNAYHNLSMSGGNSTGYLYGSYPALGDGIHLGYNFYYDSSGAGHVINTGGGTSRISADYGEVVVAVGGVGAAPTSTRIGVTTSGVAVYGTFDNHSDRNEKQDFAPVSSSQVLDEVLRLPVSEWSYKVDPKTRHVGPVAQDFYAAFNIGTDDRHIAPIDEGGLAFAAIQGLNQKLKDKDVEIQELKQSVDELKAMVKQLAAQK